MPDDIRSQIRARVDFLRAIAFYEAISFLLLLGIAMPLKYIWGQPLAVRIVGMIHGILFIIFCIALVRAKISANWPLSRAVLVFIAALLPFGPFLIDRRMKFWADAASGRREDFEKFLRSVPDNPPADNDRLV